MKSEMTRALESLTHSRKVSMAETGKEKFEVRLDFKGNGKNALLLAKCLRLVRG